MNRVATCGLPRGLELFFQATTKRRIDKLGCVFLFLTAALFFSSQTIWAGDGDLDPTFGSGGKVTTDFSGRVDFAQGVAVQTDGKIVLVGRSGIDNIYHSALVRYNTDGSLDTTFGIGGRVIVTLDEAGDLLTSVAILPNGKIVAAGALIQNNSTLGFIVARFNPDGSLDTSF